MIHRLAIGVLSLVVLAPMSSMACRPMDTHKYPTLEQNFERAKAVFVGRVQALNRSGKKRLVKMDIEKAWKSPANVKSMTSMSDEPSSCNRLGYELNVGDVCLIFLNSNDVIISDVLDGEASQCVPGKTPRAMSLANEFDDKFKSFKKFTR